MLEGFKTRFYYSKFLIRKCGLGSGPGSCQRQGAKGPGFLVHSVSGIRFRGFLRGFGGLGLGLVEFVEFGLRVLGVWASGFRIWGLRGFSWWFGALGFGVLVAGF